MLKALELVGFKSFADKTRFDFPAGITVVVGPNGSGKSNIVDAIKWVLGEQSAKSLRGKDMADVIFKGSGSGRKVMNTAEATIVIDNEGGRLPIDAVEVHVTRRVYRSGEGEYLINGQACRLRDVRDLFRGTGVGTDAYSLIEQGKVDRLLQASPRDRRAIFEEAAGISRFKAKKIEAQRRLERVDQNLLRLSDIVDEVDSRLKSVRSQATKARRYREYTQRLQELRTQVGLSDWRQLTEGLEAIEAKLEALRSQEAEATREAELREERALQCEQEALQVGETVARDEQAYGRNGERIVGLQSTVAHHHALTADLENSQRRLRSQLQSLTTRADSVQTRLSAVVALLEEAEQSHGQVASRAAELEATLSGLEDRFESLQRETEQRRQSHLEKMRAATGLSNTTSQYESQIEALRASQQRTLQQSERYSEELLAATAKLQQEAAKSNQLDRSAGQLRDELDDAERQLTELRHAVARRQEELAIQQGRISGVKERAGLLEELEARHEGLRAGVQQVLEQARGEVEADSIWADMCGVVAGLIRCDVEVARLVDVALGEAAQYVVVRGDRVWDFAQRSRLVLAGRAGFIQSDDPQLRLPSADQTRRLLTTAGVRARLDHLVRCEPQFVPLIQHLLGHTWVVDTVQRARLLAEEFPGLRFVTSAGELLEINGALLTGPVETASGLVSRRSELTALQQEISVLRKRVDESQHEVFRLQENITLEENLVKKLGEQQRALGADVADQRVVTRTLQQHCEQLQAQRDAATAEGRAADMQAAAIATQLAQAQQDLAEMEAAVAATETQIQSDEEQLATLAQQRQQTSSEVTTAQVALAKSEQQLETLRGQMSQFEEDQRDRDRAIVDVRQQLEESQTRMQQSVRLILGGTSQLAELFLVKESLARQIRSRQQERRDLHARRTTLMEEIEQLRQEIRRVESQQHKQELAAGQVRHERHSLVDRLREDYGIDIGSYQEQTSEEAVREREEVETEIDTLRRKINNIGAVNLDALEELDELESRYGELHSQFQDLTQAKDALERIIQKINADSRRLFSETLEAIRTNFQALYRKAFGGGRADIVLEEGVDILECGVEIIATPPGKPSFNNSLLSGGEKALTAVALLLAIFQFRPSPFCVLDEVDAPFDEANIGRFIEVLKEFLGWTKFVIVTHSKKTMTAATTLYGVTMQESGVSKQVSVRFEDVTEEGHIKPEALERDRDGEDEAA